MSSAQTQVAWSDEYALDLPEIDDQHKYLFGLIDKIWRAVVSKADRDTTLGVVAELERYTVTHFAAEEAFMREQQYSRYHEHRAEHEKFVARIALEKASVKAGRPLSLELMHFLRDWLVQHIRFTDRAYADEFRDREKAAMKGSLGKFFKRFLS
ncbi:MAG: hemerythrin family protein [Rhodocyclales bacterium]|nr:hemerythrin family protein [Rhodocyclales bacterium]